MTQKQVAAKSRSELNEPVDEILDFVKNLRAADNVANPSAEELKRMAERFGVRTVYGNYNFVSTVKNRSAWFTVYVGGPNVLQRQMNAKQREILSKVSETVEAVHEYVQEAPGCLRSKNHG
jgi:hypothetical protein